MSKETINTIKVFEKSKEVNSFIPEEINIYIKPKSKKIQCYSSSYFSGETMDSEVSLSIDQLNHIIDIINER